MLKHELAQKMQEIDQQLAASKRQIKVDTFSLQAAHEFFDEVLEESLVQMAMLKGENVDKKQDNVAIVLQARLMGDEEDW